MSVGQIVDATGLTQPNASNHLRCLSDCGLVAGEQRGRFVHYSLTDRRVAELCALADELLAGPLQRVADCENYTGATAAESEAIEPRRRRRGRAEGA